MICKWVLNPGKLKQCFTGTATVAFGIRRVTYPGKESYSILNVQEQYVILNISIARSFHICVLEKMNPMCYGKRKVSPTLAIAKGCYGFQLLGINLCKWLLGKQGSFLFFFLQKALSWEVSLFLQTFLVIYTTVPTEECREKEFCSRTWLWNWRQEMSPEVVMIAQKQSEKISWAKTSPFTLSLTIHWWDRVNTITATWFLLLSIICK